MLDVLLRVAGGVAVVAGAVSDRAWWRIALVVLFGLGQTGLGPLTRAVPVTVLWLAAGPLPGGFALGSAAATVLLEHTQRWDGFLETGIWLSIRQWRAVQRWTNARYARVMAGLRRGRAGREERHGER